MTFGEVFRFLEDGRKIRRHSWKVGFYWFARDGDIFSYVWESSFGVGFTEVARIYGYDLMAKDWEVVEE